MLLRAAATQLHESHDPLAVAGVRLERLEHEIVVALDARERITHQPRDVEISDGNRVGIATGNGGRQPGKNGQNSDV